MKRSLTILILSFLILLGSLIQVHGSMVGVESYSANTTEEIEHPLFFDSGLAILSDRLWFDEQFSFLDLSHKKSEFVSTVPQLLCSHRIALPPPMIRLV